MTIQMRRLKTLFIMTILLTLGSGQDSYGIMASPQNWFQAPNDEVSSRLKNVNIFSRLKKPNSQIKYFRFNEEDFSFSVIRLEDERCAKDFCLTMFFFGNIEDKTFYGMGYFPPRTAIGDVWHTPCKDCPSLNTLVFYGQDGRAKSIGYSQAGLFF